MPEFHKTGARLFVQLTAGFGRSFTISKMMETLYTNKVLRVLSKPVMDLDKITAAPSPSPNRWSDKVPSREMTVEEIQEFISRHLARQQSCLRMQVWTAWKSMPCMKAICWISLP